MVALVILIVLLVAVGIAIAVSANAEPPVPPEPLGYVSLEAERLAATIKRDAKTGFVMGAATMDVAAKEQQIRAAIESDVKNGQSS